MALSVSKKVGVGFGFILVLIAVLGVVGYFSVVGNLKVQDRLVEAYKWDNEVDEQLQRHMYWQWELSLALIEKKELPADYTPQTCGFKEFVDRYPSNDPEVLRLLSELTATHNVLREKTDHILELHKKGLDAEALIFYSSETDSTIQKFHDLTSNITQITMKDIERKIKDEEDSSVKTETEIIVAALVAFAISVIVGFMVFSAIHRVVTKLGDATNHVTSAATEILAASQEQASGAREQSSAITETTSAAKELSTTSEVVGESIKKVAQVAAHALAGMAKIKDAIDKTNGMLTSLGEKSQKIGKITDLIDDVADQTNLLAVNASIEAARAGEQGRGFTVVADEIRKLADSTAKSTKDITSLIELIQHEMSNAILSMESSVTSVDEEARLAQQTTEKAKEIAMSANQQINGAKQIAEAMLNIDEAMKQIAAGAQQSQTAARQLQELATGLKNLMVLLK